jgi:hypothetical protein
MRSLTTDFYITVYLGKILQNILMRFWYDSFSNACMITERRIVKDMEESYGGIIWDCRPEFAWKG